MSAAHRRSERRCCCVHPIEDIHRVKIGGELLTRLQMIVKTDGQFFVACDADKIWFASGNRALDILATRIEELGAPQPSPVVFQLNARLKSVIGSFVHVPETAAPTSHPTIATVQHVLRTVQNSLVVDDDGLSIDVRSSVEAVHARINCGTVFLRMFGKEISRFSKENLE